MVMESWILTHFFNPAFVAAGAALVASPILIHLINRMRYRRVRFAAMEFLLQSQRRNQRRLLIEQLLLLLLRILIVLAIVALLARLILDPRHLSIFRGAKAHHVVLLDDSASMRDRWGETSAFAEAKAVVKKIVAEGARRPDTQKFSLVLLSNPEQPFLPERDVNDAFVTELDTKLENLTATHQASDLVAGLQLIRKFLAEERGTIQQVHVVSDFRRKDWQDQKAITAAVEELTKAGVTVNLVRTVPGQHDNLAVTDLSGAVQVAAAGVPLRLTVGVKNFGTQVAKDVRLAVFDDNHRIPNNLIVEKLEPGEELTYEVDVRLATPTKHRLRVELDPDSLAEDNRRFLAVDVSNAVPVLILDGGPEGEAATYVADALAADPGSTGLSPTIPAEGLDYLRRRSLDSFSCIYLINVPELAPDALDALEKYVAAGGGLIWYLGDEAHPVWYTSQAYKQGNGVFPAPLAAASRELPEDSTNPGPDFRAHSHPLFADFVDEGELSAFHFVDVRRYYPVADDWERDDQQRGGSGTGVSPVTTLATLRNRDPLLLTHEYGQGRIITCLTTADPKWTNWPLDFTYVPLQLEMVEYVARRDRSLPVRTVGEPIELALDPAEYTDTVEISVPDSEGQSVARLQAAPVEQEGSNDLRLTATYRDTDTPGIYLARVVNQQQVPEERLFAYNVPESEGDLALVSTPDLRKRLGNNPAVRIQEPGDLEWIEGEEAGSEVRNALLVFLFLGLLAEQLLAYRLSYHPKLAGAAA